jgi:hypothetical protein
MKCIYDLKTDSNEQDNIICEYCPIDFWW